jgi:hypothetical protein
MRNFGTIRQPLLVELAMSWRERRREKMQFRVATYVYASSQGQRTHSAWTNSFDLIGVFAWPATSIKIAIFG